MKSPFDLLFQNDFDSLKSVLSDKKRTNLNQTRNGNTLLHQAVINQHLSVVQMLIDLGCDVNMQDSESGYTSLHKSLYSGQLLVTLCLLKSGRCNLAIRDKEGLTCFDLLNVQQNSFILLHYHII